MSQQHNHTMNKLKKIKKRSQTTRGLVLQYQVTEYCDYIQNMNPKKYVILDNTDYTT